MSEKLEDVYLWTLKNTGTFSQWLTIQAKALPAAIKRWEDQTRAVQDMTNVLSDETTPITDHLIRRAEALARGYGLVSEEDLAPLRQALADVARRTQTANGELESMIENLEKASLQREGDEETLERLRFEQELQRIIALEQEGADKRIAEQARRLARQEHKERLKEIKEREEAEKAANRNSRGGDAGGQSSTNNRGGISQTGGALTVNLYADGILDINDTVTLEKLARRLKPPLDDILRRTQ